MRRIIFLTVLMMAMLSFGALAEWGGSHNVTLLSPGNLTWNNTGVIDFKYNVSGNLTGTNYSCNLYHNIDQAFGIDSLQVNATVNNETFDTFRESGISENSTGWLWNVGCYTTQNSTTVLAKTNWTIKIDTTAPTSIVYSPADVTWDVDGNVTLGVNVTEANPDSCILKTNLTADTNTAGPYNSSAVTQVYLDQTFLYFDFGTNSSDNSIWLDNNTGAYLWTVSCNDSAGNIYNPSNVSFYVDSVAPTYCNITGPTNNTKSTDYTPLLNWFASVELNFSRYEVLVDNDSDFSSPEFQDNETNVSWNNMTAITGLEGDQDYFVNVSCYDVAGNKNSSDSVEEQGWSYRTDSTCHTLYSGWNICSIIRTANVNATDICKEVGDTCSYVAMYNASHNFQTYTSGAATNEDMNFSSNAESPSENSTFFVYVTSDTIYENRTWEIDANDLLFNLTNYSSGWNLVPILNRTGITLGQLDYSINGDGSGVNDTNKTNWLSYFNESAASINYETHTRNTTKNNQTFVPYGDSVWVHINKTVLNQAFYWNSSGEY